MSERFIGINPILFGGWANSAARVHDLEYVASSVSGKTRKEVDDQFLYDCLYLASKGRFKQGKVAQAYVMYGMVRALGWIWWDGNE